MKPFMGKNFLLTNDTAKLLYHHYAAKLPIIDYHCHVSPKEIAEDKHYANITELWLGGDHYKWRALRSCGVPEKYITGNASDYEKFRAYATVMPRLIGNPLYHWSHLELQRYFGFDGNLSAETADEVWELCNARLAEPKMGVRNIIKVSGVEVLCTTDDPVDSLEWHEKIAATSERFPVRVLPAWRPDKGLNIDRDGWRAYMTALENAAGIPITDWDSLKKAYAHRLNFFAEHGCCTADHGMDEQIVCAPESELYRAGDIFVRALHGEMPNEAETAIFKTALLLFFAEHYTKMNWVMQIHFGVLRNVNSKRMKELGPDSGFDVIGGRSSLTELARLLDLFSKHEALPRMILYSINPADNAGIGALIGAFQENPETEEFALHRGMPRIMQGSAWWFNDHMTGIRDQLISLANLSALGCFVGMLTDSRSFISYTRHEYFRRILCNLLGEWAEAGEYPQDPSNLAEIVMDLCYNNAKNFFRL